MSVGGINNGFNIDPSYKKDTTNVNVNKNIGKSEEIKKSSDVTPSYSKNNDVKINKNLSSVKGLEKGLSFNFVDKQQASPAKEAFKAIAEGVDVVVGAHKAVAEKMLNFFDKLF
ncbi:MAG: hypothetical protein U0354_10025 [Candidatus Sericytochromatia bacterium]